MRRNETYSLGLVTAWLQKNNVPYYISNADIGCFSVNHGCRIRLPKGYVLSVQTHPEIAGNSFAETALLYDDQLAFIHGYEHDVARWEYPEELFEHILHIVSLPY